MHQIQSAVLNQASGGLSTGAKAHVHGPDGLQSSTLVLSSLVFEVLSRCLVHCFARTLLAECLQAGSSSSVFPGVASAAVCPQSFVQSVLTWIAKLACCVRALFS
mmetsp:Transcript_7643/g.18081  ORF Transcript_7643/g.18081 Transcript_7643/m.18081 type:complete len:105 (+) Transcript_7643:870-1184(+)